MFINSYTSSKNDIIIELLDKLYSNKLLLFNVFTEVLISVVRILLNFVTLYGLIAYEKFNLLLIDCPIDLNKFISFRSSLFKSS